MPIQIKSIMHEAQIPMGKSRCSRFSQTAVSVVLLALAFGVVGKLSSPGLGVDNLLKSWTSSLIVSINTLANASQCMSPNFLLFSYDFKGMAMGCACNTSVVHSGYCTKKEAESGCREMSPIYPQKLTNFNSSGYLCAMVATPANCSEMNRSCASNFCTSDPNYPCPLLDLQVAVFPPGNDYFSVADLDFNGESLYASKLSGASPLFRSTTIKGNRVCLDSSIENVEGFVNTVYKEVTLQQEQCRVGTDSRWRLLSSMEDFIMYQSNNMSISPQGNFFNVFVKGIGAVSKDSVDHCVNLSRLGSRFEAVCILVGVGYALLIAGQQAILHRFQAASPLILLIYATEMFIGSYSYTRVADYLSLTKKITLTEQQSQKEMAEFQESVDVCSRMLLALSVISAVATTLKAIKLVIELRKVCKRMKSDDSDHK